MSKELDIYTIYDPDHNEWFVYVNNELYFRGSYEAAFDAVRVLLEEE